MNDMLLPLISGFSIGLIGSLHCVGMCGPLALSLPVHHLNPVQKPLAIAFYNFGRSFSYAAIGIFFGLIGQSFWVFKLQQWLSIVAGSLILAVFVFQQLGHLQFGAISRFTQAIKQKLGILLRSEKNLSAFFSIGVLNGFLPCGLVYVAIGAALATGTVLKSSLLMFAFGLGTIPLMALTMVFGKFISQGLRAKFSRLIPHITVFVAVLLILRGLNLGIPLVSPAYHQGNGNSLNPPPVVHCH